MSDNAEKLRTGRTHPGKRILNPAALTPIKAFRRDKWCSPEHFDILDRYVRALETDLRDARIDAEKERSLTEQHARKEKGVAWQVELDAIEPRALQGLVREAIVNFFDEHIGQQRDEELRQRRERIRGWLDDAVNPDFQMPGADA